MKRIIVLSILAVALFSCEKEVESASESKILTDIKSFSNLNSEGERIQDDVIDADHTVAIIDNANYGEFSSTPENDIMMSGASSRGYSITINSSSYSADSTGQWLRRDGAFKNYIGNTNSITITSPDAVDHSFSRYIPSAALGTALASGDDGHQISRTGNTIEYTTDMENPAEAVALFYQTFETPNLGDPDGMVDNGVVLLDNSGTYNIDGLIADPQVKRIFFKLISGNTISEVIDGEKFLFYIATYDHHEYTIGDE